ncbi:MAG TPA: dihydrolipoyl dehydrogenase [Herpetosiphonaceae bacterium]|nr:dihydrolipoyl dehydrogenase [Herpetosiphonaceae bacterium]
MADTQYDVAVIGAGPGGYVAAIRASQLGMKAAVIERGELGGVCLNVGCIPTKALLHSAELLDEAKEGKRVGVVADNVRVDWTGVMGHKERVVKQMTGGVGGLMKKNKIDVIRGFGKLASPTSVLVSGDGGDQTVQARNIIVATGSAPKGLPFAPIDEEMILSSTGALALKEIPKRLVVIGGGVIGCELASAYRSFGTDVTIVEALPRLVTTEDEEISAELEKVFNRRGIKTQLGAKVAGVDRSESGVVVTFTDKTGKEQQLPGDKLLLAVGRGPLTRGIGLEELGIKTDERGYVQVNGMMQTNVPSVYSIGDCVPTPWLAHVASAEGILAVEHMAGRHVEPINYDKIPACTYSSPEIGSAGLSEAKAKERGYEVKVGRFPFSANGKAAILANRTGFVKIVADKKYDEILGVHMIGPRVTELIAEGGMVLSHEATSESMVHTVHAHPTLYEAILEAAHGLIDGPIHF